MRNKFSFESVCISRFHQSRLLQFSLANFNMPIFICQFSFANFHLPIFICQFSFVNFNMLIFICPFSFANFHLPIFICQFQYANFHMPTSICQFSFAQGLNILSQTLFTLFFTPFIFIFSTFVTSIFRLVNYFFETEDSL